MNKVAPSTSQSTSPAQVCIVDDHDAIRLGFKGACQEYGLDLIGSAASVGDLIPVLAGRVPQVVVLDLSLADGSQPDDNVSRLRALGSQVVIFSIADKHSLNQKALKAGAAAIVPKADSMQQLISTIELVASGVVVNNTQTTAAIDSDREFKMAALSPREREVLSLYASGLALKQVATQLSITYGTAKTHIDRVRTKYADIGRPTSNRTELLIRAIEDGVLDQDWI